MACIDKTMSQVLLTSTCRCYMGAKEEYIVFCLEKAECLQANWLIGMAGRKKDFKEKQQEVQRHTFHLVFPKYMVGAPKR